VGLPTDGSGLLPDREARLGTTGPKCWPGSRSTGSSRWGSAGLSPAQRRVLEALPTDPPGISPKEIGDRVVEQGWEAGLHRVTIQNALTVLAEMGLADGADGRWWRCSPGAE
jgi:hypothetical protein